MTNLYDFYNGDANTTDLRNDLNDLYRDTGFPEPEVTPKPEESYTASAVPDYTPRNALTAKNVNLTRDVQEVYQTRVEGNKPEDSSWSRVMRSVKATLELVLLSSAQELKKLYINIDPMREMTDLDNRTILVNLDDSDLFTGTRIILYCEIADKIHPMLILAHEKVIDSLTLIGVTDIEAIIIYKYSRDPDSMIQVDPKQFIKKVYSISLS